MFSKHKSKPDGLQSYCKKCSNTLRVKWARDNTGKARVHAMKYNYGISKEQYETMLRDQDNSCKICSKNFDKTTPRVDHDHSCCSGGKGCGNCVRGLLCNRCNLFLGFYENFKFMEGVRDYLKR